MNDIQNFCTTPRNISNFQIDQKNTTCEVKVARSGGSYAKIYEKKSLLTEEEYVNNVFSYYVYFAGEYNGLVLSSADLQNNWDDTEQILDRIVETMTHKI